MTLHERDYLWFQSLNYHGPLSSTTLYELGKHLSHDVTSADKRLGDLYHENNTYHRGAYLERVKPRYSPKFSLHVDCIYDLTDASRAALEAIDVTPKKKQGRNQLFEHQAMLAAFTASIEIACRNLGYRFIPDYEILKGKLLEIPCSISHDFPHGTKTCNKPLIPDALFGIEKDGLTRYFFLEVDRDSEPVYRGTFDLSSYLRKFLQYQAVIQKGLYKEFLDTDKPALVLNVTTSKSHLRSIMEMANDVTNGKGAPYFMAKAYPDYSNIEYTVPKPILDILTTSFERPGKPPMTMAW